MRQAIRSVTLTLALMAPTAMRAQRSLAERISAAGTRTVAFNTSARAGTCGDGTNSYNDGLSNPRSRVYDGYMLLTHEPWDTRIPPCEAGPVRVTVRVVEGQPSWMRTAVGPLAALGDSVTNLGAVSTAEARAFLEPLALKSDGRASLEAIMPLVLIDSVPRWNILERIARDSTHLSRYRRRAADILARGAASTIAQEAGVDDDTRTARREAVYALARQKPERSADVVPDLVNIARSNPHRDARVAALYQLGQTVDARGIELFTSMLKGTP